MGRLRRSTLCAVSRELIHPVVAERAPRGEVVVYAAEQADVLDRRRASAGSRNDVIELDAQRRPADAA